MRGILLFCPSLSPYLCAPLTASPSHSLFSPHTYTQTPPLPSHSLFSPLSVLALMFCRRDWMSWYSFSQVARGFPTFFMADTTGSAPVGARSLKLCSVKSCGDRISSCRCSFTLKGKSQLGHVSICIAYASSVVNVYATIAAYSE